MLTSQSSPSLRKLAATTASRRGRKTGALAFRSVGAAAPSATLSQLTPWGKDAKLISPGTFFLHVTLPLALLHLGPQTALPESRETTFHDFSLLNR